MSTESSTLAGIEKDLREAESELQVAQIALIADLEAGVKLEDLREKEQLVEALTAKRDELAETKQFVIDRAREAAVRDKKKHSTALYLSRWAESFSPSEISSLVTRANARNEAVGITGVLYVFRGWFGSFLEGEEFALTQLLKRIAQDPRHCQFAIVRRESNLPADVPRRFPRTGLTLRRMDETVVDHRTTYECHAIQHLAHQMSLSAYVPHPVLSDGASRRAMGENVQMDNLKRVISQRPAPHPIIKQFVLSVTPHESFWSVFSAAPEVHSTAKLKEVLSQVHSAVKSVVELPVEESRLVSAGGTAPSTNPDHFQGTVVAPHGSCVGVTATLGSVAHVAISRAMKIWNVLKKCGVKDSDEKPQKEGELFILYRPTIALHFGAVEPVMNGSCNVIGAPMRMVRLLTNLAVEQGFPIVFSDTAADEAQKEEMQNLGKFEIDRESREVWAPKEIADLRWDSIVAAAAQTALSDAAQQGGTPQVIAAVHHKRKAPPSNIDEVLNVPTPKRLETEAELRKIFSTLNPDPVTDTVTLADFSALYSSQDSFGIIEDPREVESLLTQQFAVNLDEPDRLNFQQFCMLWYRRLKT